MARKITCIKKMPYPDFNVKIGTFDRKEPEVVFVVATAYVCPGGDLDNESSMKNVRRAFTRSLKKMVSDSSGLFKSSYISSLDVSTDRMEAGKKSFFTLEYYLKQLSIRGISDLEKDKDAFIDPVINGVSAALKEEGYSISKTK